MSSSICSIKVSESTPFAKLEKYIGKNTKLQTTIFAKVTKGDNFSPEFIKWYQEKYNTKDIPNIEVNDESLAEKLAKDALDYYNSVRISVNDATTLDATNDVGRKFGYSSDLAREEGKKHTGAILLDIFKNVIDKGIVITEDKLDYYRTRLKNRWRDNINAEISRITGKPVSEIEAGYVKTEAAKRLEYYDNLLGGKDKTLTGQNLMAVYKELFGSKSTANMYIEELLANKNLNPILGEIKDEVEIEVKKYIDQDADNNVVDDNDFDSDEIAQRNAIAQFDHSGMYSSFMAHVGPRIILYFNTLRKHKSAAYGDLDTNNIFGIAETMDAQACCSMLYNSSIWDNIDSMIKGIEDIANTVPGFEAFIQLARDLRENLDFATEFRTVFAKTKIDRIETIYENGETKTRVSNVRSNARATFVFDCRNNARNCINSMDEDTVNDSLAMISSLLSTIDKAFKNINDLSEDVRNNANKDIRDTIPNIISRISKLLRGYFPNISEEAIKAFVELGNNANGQIEGKITNIKSLIADIKELNENRKEAIEDFKTTQIKLAEARKYNQSLKEKEDNNQFVSKREYIDIKSLYTDDFVDRFDTTIRYIADKLLPYSIVNTNINAKTIEGKNQSSVINNSFITNIKNMLDASYKQIINGKEITRNPKLEAWGLAKARSSQYKYSNLLFEQIDDKGNILNRNTALFRYVDGQLCLTDYADEVLRVYQFSGASNIDTNTNLSYSKMNMGDFFPTAYINFFNSVDSKLNNIPTALYFLPTPSDAPNTFAIRGPRHNTNGIFKIANEEEFNAELEKIANKTLNLMSPQDIFNKGLVNVIGGDIKFDASNGFTLKDILTRKRKIIVATREAIKPISEPDDRGSYEAYVTFVPKDGNGTIVVLKGRIDKVGKSDILNNAEIVATSVPNTIIKNEAGRDVNMIEEVKGIIKTKYTDILQTKDVIIRDEVFHKAERIIDTSHPVFQMFKNTFKQELLDAATAIDKYFKLVPVHGRPGVYVVEIKDGKPTMIKDNNSGYINYHLDKNGEVFKKKNKQYTLGGKVFNSTKFTLTIDVNGEVKNVNFMDEVFSHEVKETNNGVINFLYGGATEILKNDDGKVTDILLNDEQNITIDKAISKFIENYIEQAVSVVEEYSDFIKDTNTELNDIIEYALNEYLMRLSYADLLVGNDKFYKGGQDILKRAKEYQGSGVPYGISDYSSSYLIDINAPINNSFLNEGTITEPEMETIRDISGRKITRQKRDSKGNLVTKETSVASIIDSDPILKGTRQRNGFYGVTIKNSIRTNTEVLTQLRDNLVSNGVPQAIADELMFGSIVKIDKKTGEPIRKGGFTETKVNDAQSYITYNEWVRRIAARGQLKKYLPLIKKLANPNSILTASDIKEFVQLQKNFYYDLYYDEEFDMYVPRQIKNAEFVLVPRLIKGTQLEDVYKLMRKAGIDQLNTKETSKAANKDVLTLWDNDGNISQERLDNFTNEAIANKQVFSYNYLYTQQETPQHMNAENKAGIQIMKKIIDNLPNDESELGKLKKEFLSLYSQNIEESKDLLIKELNIPTDENGNIIVDENGNIEGLNYEVLYNKLKDELMRNGMDSNAKDYVTIPKGETVPAMPSYINNYLTKFESIVQSIFNSTITRQKLPGFHAGQITQIGWRAGTNTIIFEANKKGKEAKVKDKLTLDEYEKLDDTQKTYYDKAKGNIRASKDLRYHPNGESYIEVMLPYSFLGIDKNSEHYKNMTDEEIIEELSKEDEFGLDTFIGYRIPTEGKQSACRMKLVGFISDAYGSTIVVPDDWVSQTGSDFDIDSVYGIQYETYKKADGQVKKVKYKETVDKYDWFAYINRYISDNDFDKFTKGKLVEGIKALKNEQDKFDSLTIEQESAYNDLTDKEKQTVKKVQSKITEEINKKKLTGKASFQYRCTTLIPRLSDYIKALEDYKTKTGKGQESIDRFTRLKESIEGLKSILDNQVDNYSEATKNYIDKTTSENIEKYNKIANDLGLLSLSEFVAYKNIIKANGKKARNSRILDIMQSVLDNKDCLEENLSRSNFDKLVEARNDIMSDDVTTERINRSPYNPFDQFRYQQEVMSGATLKAFSVTLDTFCSVCNAVKPTLNIPIYVIYDAEKKSEDELKTHFGEVEKKGKGVAVKHDKYGWSLDNRNSDGYILTSYSSQTTAYILDAVKEGSIPNLNTYTFSVFKTLANVGCDYRAVLSFIMQPGVKAIVDAYNANNSVYAKSGGNPIHKAIETLAKNLELDVSPNTPAVALLKSINKKYGKEFNKLFKQEGDSDIVVSLNDESLENLPIIVEKFIDRIKHRGEFKNSSPVKEALFDIGVAILFNRLYNTANTIGDIARCCNPDKFGAKQTVYSTREIFNNIDKCIYDREENTDLNIFTAKKLRNAILTVDDKHILESIYPGVTTAGSSIDSIVNFVASKMDTSKSSYKTLATFLKDSSALSAVIARTIFPTQNSRFVQLINGLKTTFSGYKPILSEETYSEFQRYVLSSLYNDVPAIKYGVKVRSVDGKIKLTYDTEVDVERRAMDDRIAIDRERNRIFGYEHTNSTKVVKLIKTVDKNGKPTTVVKYIDVNIKDINNPKEEELELFEQLSPAQKIYYIQQHTDDAGIFSLIDVALYNDATRGTKYGMQSLEFRDENINSNVVYNQFKKALFNKNPLYVSAAIDIIKYAVQVEGFKMTARAVNKVIDNSALLSTFEEGGTGFIDSIKVSMDNIFGNNSPYREIDSLRRLYENYLRSHPNIKEIKTFYLSKHNLDKYNIRRGSYGTIFIKRGDNVKAFDKMLEDIGIKYQLPITEESRTNSYIRIKNRGESTLYKIVDAGEYVILYPLNNLEVFENTEWSCNEDNNVHPSQEFYKYLISSYAKESKTAVWEHEYIQAKYEQFKKDEGKVYYSKRRDRTQDIPADDFSFEELSKEYYEVEKVKQKILDYFRNNTLGNNVLSISSPRLYDYIHTEGIINGSTQEIKFGPNDVRTFDIFIPEIKTKLEKAFLRRNAEGKFTDPATMLTNPTVIDIIRKFQGVTSYLPGFLQVIPHEEAKIDIEEEDDTDAFAQSFEEINSEVVSLANSFSRKNDTISENEPTNIGEISNTFLRDGRLEILNLNSNMANSNIEQNALAIAKYANDLVEHLDTYYIRRFVENPEVPDTFFSITDKEVLNLIQKDANIRERYMKAYNVLDSFIRTFSKYNNYNSDNPDVQRYIESIRRAYDKVAKLPLTQIRDKGINAIAATITTNPLMRQGLIDVLDGFWKTYGHMWQYNDIQENGTPVIQIFLKDVMRDIDAKKKQFSTIRKDYWDKINDIKARAKAAGVDIDMSKIIDEDGRFTNNFISDFADDLEELKEAVKDAHLRYGIGSIEHLKAKNKLDIFKSIYIHQEAVQGYYGQLALLDKNMLDHNPEVFSKYKKLLYQRNTLINYADKHGTTKEIEKEIKQLDNKIDELTNFLVIPEEFLFEDVANPFYQGPIDRSLKPGEFKIDDSARYSEAEFLAKYPDHPEFAKTYSAEAAHALKNYIKQKSELDKLVFEYADKFEFEANLKANLAIIAAKEDRDELGVPRTPQSVLDFDEEYQYAKKWIYKNARFYPNITGKNETLGDKLYNALELIGFNSAAKSKFSRNLMRDNDIYDEYNIPDGSKLSEEDRAKLAEAQGIVLTNLVNVNSDRTLISNASPIKSIFNKHFYRQMRFAGEINPEYRKLVAELNNLLLPHFKSSAGIVDLTEIPDTKEGIAELKAIADLYLKLNQLTKREADNNDEVTKRFIRENVEFHINDDIMKAQTAIIMGKSQSYREVMGEIMYERDENGNFIIDGNGNYKANSKLYGYITPKGKPGEESYDKWLVVDKETGMTLEEAIDMVSKAYIKTPTQYYHAAKNEAIRKAKENPSTFDFVKDWYLKNHVYNPYTHKMEPLDCWVISELNPTFFGETGLLGRWEATFNFKERKIKDGITKFTAAGVESIRYEEDKDMRDQDYDENKNELENYAVGAQGGKYDNKVVLNKYEEELRDYLKDLLKSTAHTSASQKFFEKGYLPRQAKKRDATPEMVVKEIFKMIGIGISTHNGMKQFDDTIDYSTDRSPVMPMTKFLNSKQTVDIEKQIKELDENEPTEDMYDDATKFADEHKIWRERKAELKKQLKAERESIMDKDWLNVIANYLNQANNYNAILDNKNKLYFLLSAVRDLKMYSRHYGAYGDLKKDNKRSTENITVYDSSIDSKLIQQLEDWMKRILFDQWKEQEGALTNFANAIQGFTSANYMMLNVRGGIANVTLGETGILAEAAAGEVLDTSDWRFGTRQWMAGSMGMIAGAFNSMVNSNSPAVNKQDAICRYFNVVDYDELTGVVRDMGLEEYSKHLRDFMFSPQTIGEHFMQNSVLFGMMHSHKVIYDKAGQAHIMNVGEYIALKEEEILSDMLDGDTYNKFLEFKESLKEDKNKLARYAWFRRDALVDFLYLHTDNKTRKEFVKLRKEKHNEFKKEFKEKQDIYSQCDFRNGEMVFVDDSELDKLSKELANATGVVSKANYLLGEFSERVRKTNNKIHGIYNRLGAANIEKKWYGSLIMQYHKHLPMGLLKRYMNRGHWNEVRGSVDKGMVQSIIDIASLNFRKIRVEAGLTETEETALKSWCWTLSHLGAYFSQLKETLAICPAYDRANLLRNLGDAVGVVGAMLTVAALWYIADDDENMQDSRVFNLCLYEADRLASEAFLYNPFGMANETKKLMSTPIAAQSVLDDALASVKFLVDYTLDDEFNTTYESGRFAGENKFSVYVQRRIPIWNGIRHLIDITDNNQYYKLGQNPIGITNIKEKVTDNN